MEHVAEATAYVVGRQFALPMEYSATYLKRWGASPADLERHLGTVRDISKEMIVGIGEQLEIVRREEQAASRKLNDKGEQSRVDDNEISKEMFVRYHGRLYGEDQVTDLMTAFGASDNLDRERVELVQNRANPWENPQFHPIEKLSAKSYQNRLLLEFAEFVGQDAGAKFVWISGDGTFGYAIDPDEIPDGVQAVPVNAEEELAVVAKA